MSMKPYSLAVCALFGLLAAGCSHTLPPHQEINQALQKTLATSGYNYTSKSRLTELALPEKEIKADTSTQQYLQQGIEAARGITVSAEGAVDLKAKKSEVVYHVRYDQDNLEVSIKIPLLFDYGTQNLYVGTTFLNRILPLPPGSKGKMIKIDLNEVLQQLDAKADKLKEISGKKGFDALQEGLKTGILKGFAELKDERFADQPLQDDDKAGGVVRRVGVQLNREESVGLLLTIADAVIQRFYQDGILTKEEYGSLMILTDRQKIDSYLESSNLALTLAIGLDAEGRISRMETRLAAADKDNAYRLGLENISSFKRYDAPLFSMKPELTGTVDYKVILDAYMTARAAAKAKAEAAKEKPAKPEEPKEQQQPGN